VSARGVGSPSEPDLLQVTALVAAAARSLPRGFGPLQRSRPGRSTCTGLASPGCGAAPRVSHPLDDLLPAWPSGLVSCRWRSWGFALQSFSLRTKP
jgi:hypothetical protein